jgi:ubiquinone/menaquinone biosynthesis C-methylase UbiE
MSKEFQLVQRIEFIREACENKTVLHLGCTNWPYTREAIDSNMLLHYDLEKIAKEIFGFDYDQAGLDILANHGSKNLFRADLEKLSDVELDRTFDVIVAGEMIEHLNNPGIFLDGIKRFMNSETRLVLTTINAYCALRFFIYGLRGKGGLNEPVHPDHVAYYSYKTLKLLIERKGLRLNDFSFYDVGEDHRQHNPWYYNFINDICVKFSPQLSDGVIAVCTLDEG